MCLHHWCKILPIMPLLATFACHFAGCKAAKILVVPNQSLSHTRYFAEVSKALVENEHEVYGVMNGACSKSMHVLNKAGVKVLPYYTHDGGCYTELDPAFSENIFSTAATRSPHKLLQSFTAQSAAFLSDGRAIFNNHTYFTQLDDLGLDLVLLDGFLLTLYNYLIPYRLGVAHASLVTIYVPFFTGVSALPSFTPVLTEPVTDNMDFNQRLKNTIDTIALPALISTMPSNSDSLIDEFVPQKSTRTTQRVTSLMTLMRWSSLWLLNTDPVLDYPRMSLPHIINIGGLSVSSAKPLPEGHLKDIMDAALADNGGSGAAIITFGSLAKDFPEDIIEKIITAFSDFPEVTFIMKYNSRPIDRQKVPRNVYLLEWIPQNDLLGHPATKLFITHSGNNGQFEGLYHAVPMIAMPLFGDQFYNAKRMAVKGFGLTLNPFDFTSEQLARNIQELLTNSSYKEAIRKASLIYRHQYQTARQRAVYWIEHILQYGSNHLKSHALEMPWYEYWMIDVICALVFGVCLALSAMFVVFLLTLWGCYRVFRKLSSKKFFIKPKQT